MSLYDAKMPSLKDKIKEEADRLEAELEKKEEKQKKVVKIIKKKSK